MLRMSMTLLLAAAITAAQAQVLTFGPRVGISYSKMVADETFTSEGTDFEYATQDAKVGLLYGAFGRIKAGPVFIQPEIAFTQDKTEIEVSSINLDEIQTLTVNKLDIPILAGVKLGKYLKVMGGPVNSYIRSTHVHSPTDLWDSYRSEMEESTWGYQLGAGLEMGRFMMDARYEGRFGPVINEATIGNQTYTFDHRSQIFQFSLSYKLIK